MGVYSGVKVKSEQEALEALVTPKQKEIFLVIDEFWKKFGYGPSIDNIMFITGDKSRGNVARLIRRLCELGVCKKLPNRARSVRPVYINFRKIQ